VIRDGLKIIPALMEGNPEPLFAAFPWVIDMVLARYAPPQNAPATNNNGGGELSPKGTAALQTQLDQITKYIMAGGSVPIAAAAPAISGNLIAGSNAVQFTPSPMEDDFDLLDTIEIKKDETAAARSSENLRNTLMAMYNGQGVWAAKPPDASKPTRAGRGKQLDQSLA
jgi:hypothetical protein